MILAAQILLGSNCIQRSGITEGLELVFPLPGAVVE
jgi:hypothetical protein